MIFNPTTHKVFLGSLTKKEAEVYVGFLEGLQLRHGDEIKGLLKITGMFDGDKEMLSYCRFLQSEVDIKKDKIKRIDILIDIVKLRKGLK